MSGLAFEQMRTYPFCVAVNASHRLARARRVNLSQRLQEVKFVRFLSPQLAVMHAVVRVTLPGRSEPSPGRDSMRLFVVTKHDGEWRVEAMHSRKLTFDRQYFSDDFDSLPAGAQRQVTDLV